MAQAFSPCVIYSLFFFVGGRELFMGVPHRQKFLRAMVPEIKAKGSIWSADTIWASQGIDSRIGEGGQE